MKTIVLLITGLLFGIAPVAAEHKSASQGEDLSRNFYYDQPITFIERGVEFLIFPDGSFDFNTELHTTPGDVYYRKTTTIYKRRSINTTYGAPGTYYTPRPRGIIITHDRDGKVRRIGNVFLNYNRHGQIKRIGSVYINYNIIGYLTRVGGLQIHYRNHNVVRITGHVNRYNRNNIIGNYNMPQHQNNTDDDYYYYKKNGKDKKIKKLKRS
jgi:hypothetical protein